MNLLAKKNHPYTRHWVAQRFTALALIPLILWFIIQFLPIMRANHHTALQGVSNPFTAMMLALFLVTLFYHAYLGLRVIIEDYVHIPWRKYASLILLNFFVLALGTFAFISIVRIIVLSTSGSVLCPS